MKTILKTGFWLGMAAWLAVPALAQDRQQMRERMQQMRIGEVRGTVVDDDTGEPLASATVALWSVRDSSLVTGVVADVNGAFVIDQLFPGRYYAKVSFLGFLPETIDGIALPRDAPKRDLGTIRLQPDAQQLEGIEVTSQRETVEFGLDRTVYNTRDQVVTAGGSASEVLQNIPSVEVDIDGKLSLRGNQNVAVQINGKPAPVRGDFLATFLQQLPGDAIERIEVIPNPSAKYDPDGMAGIINIVLKQDADLGLSGGVTVGAATGDKYNASGNVNFQRGKFSLYTSYGFRYDDRTSLGENLREDFFRNPTTILDQDNDGIRNRVSHLLSANTDYRLSDKGTLSASALVTLRQGSDEEAVAYLFQNAADGSQLNVYNRGTDGDEDGFNMDYSLGYKHIVTPREHEFSADLRYNHSAEDDFELFNQQYTLLDGNPSDLLIRQQTTLDALTDEGELQVDYVRPLGRFALEAGGKSTLRRLDNTFYSESFDADLGVFQPDVNLNNAFIYDEQVHAVYGILSTDLGAFSVQGGLRAEQAFTDFSLETTNEAFDNNYFSLFPSAFVSYKLTEGSQLKASYSKRINRPRTRQLNPFTSFDDPLNLRVGNPALNPEYTHAFEVGYQWFNRIGSLSLTPFFRRTVDTIERFKSLDPGTGVSTLTFRNFDTRDSYGAEVVGSLRLGQKINSFASFSAYRVVTDASNVGDDLSNNAFSWSVRGNVSWQVRRGLDVQAFAFYRAPFEIAQGRISSFFITNFAVRQQLMGDKASLSLRLSDPFDQMRFRFEIADQFYAQESFRKRESRVLYLTFTYNFGSNNDRNRNRNRDRGGMDEGGGDVGID